MTLHEIKTAINQGKKVYWDNLSYEIIKSKNGQYLINCSGNCIGLTELDGVTMNIPENEVFTKEVL